MQKESSNFKFGLDINSCKEIPFDKYPKDFSFIVNGDAFKTSRIFADLLSPIVCQYHFTDPTISQYFINTQNQNPQFDFSKILSLISFQPIDLTNEEVEYFIEIFAKLGNKREIQKLLPRINEKITIKNVFSLLHQKQKYKPFFNQLNQHQKEAISEENNFIDFIRAELDYISSHFFEIDPKEIEKLDFELIEEIIKSDKLLIEDEDSLLKFINSIYLKNQKSGYLYSYINFVFVSNDVLHDFADIFDVNDVNNQIWKSVLNRIFESKVTEKSIQSMNANKRYTKKIERGIPLLYKDNDDFNGIIKYLTKKTGGNIHDNGTINVSSSANYNEPKNLLDFNFNTYYQTKLLKDGWVIFDFKNKKVKINKYSIMSNDDSINCSNMKSWDIEVSNDGKSWLKIDERKDCQEINGCHLTGTFDVKENDYSRYIRLHQTDNNWSNNYAWFYYIEFYGYLLE